MSTSDEIIAPLRHAIALRQTLVFVVVLVGVCVLLRLLLGPLAQPSAYHQFADQRVWHFIPNAANVLSNCAILAAGLYGWRSYSHMRIGPCERPATIVLIIGAVLTSLGSAYYHWNPNNDTLLWDRLPMMFAMMPPVALLAADRIDPALARASLWPMIAVAIASVLYWSYTESIHAGDLRPYVVVRIASGAAIVLMLSLCRPRHTHSHLLVYAVAAQIVLVLFEHFDHQVFAALNRTVSGHTMKHLVAGLALAWTLMWLKQRRKTETSNAEEKY